MALVLSFAAGFVDIVGALTVYNLFTAHVTGTTVRMGERIVERQWSAAIAALIVVGSFFVASLIGRVLIEAAQRARFNRVASITLAVETALLLCVIAIGTGAHIGVHTEEQIRPLIGLVLALLAASMGLQTATLTKIGPLTVHTTFVTGMLNKLAQVVALWLFDVHDLRTGRQQPTQELRGEIQKHARHARLLLSIWICYLSGAAGGTWLSKSIHLKALILPCCILLIVIAIDQARPLSIEEEQEQAE